VTPRTIRTISSKTSPAAKAWPSFTFQLAMPPSFMVGLIAGMFMFVTARIAALAWKPASRKEHFPVNAPLTSQSDARTSLGRSCTRDKCTSAHVYQDQADKQSNRLTRRSGGGGEEADQSRRVFRWGFVREPPSGRNGGPFNFCLPSAETLKNGGACDPVNRRNENMASLSA
jgi:hypothetical protein